MTEIEYRAFEGHLSDEVLVEVVELVALTLHVPRSPPAEPAAYMQLIRAELAGYRWIYLCLAYEGPLLVGYKLGRSSDPRTFESRLGGVRLRARRRGIASELARRQEAWCRTHGFRFLVTEAHQDNDAMLILNLKRGFKIVGTTLSRTEHLKVQCEKALFDDDAEVDSK